MSLPSHSKSSVSAGPVKGQLPTASRLQPPPKGPRPAAEPARAAGPAFAHTPLEARAIAVMELLSGKQPSLPLSPEARRHADALTLAFRQGNKQKAFQLSAEFFAQVLTPGRLQAAFALVQAQGHEGHGDYQIMMDGLKELSQPVQAPVRIDLTLDEALELMLLAVNRSDKSSISYNRVDAVTGKPRPTTFPLTEAMLMHFLAPFGEKAGLLRRALIISRGVVMGNPAALIARDWHLRRRVHEDALARETAIQPKPAQVKASPGSQSQEVRIIVDELAQLLTDCPVAEKQALLEALQPEPMQELITLSRSGSEPRQASKDFGKQLEAIYGRHLSRQQSSLLAARLSSRMKRMLSKMGDWKEEFWADFQAMMQLNGVWEGEAWLEKWRAVRSGKQHLARSGKDYLLEAPAKGVDQLIAQSERIKDKQRGRHMLSPGDDAIWKRPASSNASPELRKVLAALSHSERLDALIDLALPESQWQAAPELLRARLYQGFCLLSDTDLDCIKTQYLAAAEPAMLESAKALIAAVELACNQLASLLKKDPRLGFGEGLEILVARQRELEERQRLNSREYQNSAAFQYGKYA